MFTTQILSQAQSFSIDSVRLDAIAQYIATVVDIPQQGILNLAFLPDEEIQVLNHQYRGIDSTTDVLSFHYADDFSETLDSDIAGEIIMSESRVISQAIDHGHTTIIECEILLIHGILHILGYDHEDDQEYDEMWRFEKPIRKHFWLSF